jgi:hypothetical protein
MKALVFSTFCSEIRGHLAPRWGSTVTRCPRRLSWTHEPPGQRSLGLTADEVIVAELRIALLVAQEAVGGDEDRVPHRDDRLARGRGGAGCVDTPSAGRCPLCGRRCSVPPRAARSEARGRPCVLSLTREPIWVSSTTSSFGSLGLRGTQHDAEHRRPRLPPVPQARARRATQLAVSFRGVGYQLRLALSQSGRTARAGDGA